MGTGRNRTNRKGLTRIRMDTHLGSTPVRHGSGAEVPSAIGMLSRIFIV
jgi:hypothetical protein